METFGYKGGMKFQAILSCAYPVIALGGMGALYFFVVRDSSGMFEMKDWAPLAAVGIFIWLIYEIYKVSRMCSFSVRISDEGVGVGKSEVYAWDQVERAEFHGLQFGTSPVITLHLRSGETLKIPAAIDHLPYIQGIIENKVENIVNPGK